MDAAARKLDSRETESRVSPSAGSNPRLELLLHRYLGFVWRCLRRLGVTHEDADDAAQRVFIVLAGQLSRVEPGRERAFLFGTAVRVAANARRHQQRTPRHERGDLDELCIDLRDPEWLLQRRQARDLLDTLMAELPEAQRQVFTLSEIEGLAKAEVAAVLQIPEGTVASRLRRARAYLERRLEAYRDSCIIGVSREP